MVEAWCEVVESMTDDPVAANECLLNQTPDMRLALGVSRIAGYARTVALTSAGIDSSVNMAAIDLYNRNHPNTRPIDAIFINTGGLFPETLEHRDTLARTFTSTRMITIGPDRAARQEIGRDGLRESRNAAAIARLSFLTKLQPLMQFEQQNPVGLVVSGAYGEDKTVLSIGPDKHWRLNPFADHTKAEMRAIMENNNLPQHSLRAAGYDSVGDVEHTVPGEGRSGRAVGVCALQSPDVQVNPAVLANRT